MIQLCAPCLFGIEGILADELKRMGASEVQAETGRVLFGGEAAMIARANLRSRYAERIQIVLGRFPARTFEELFDGVARLPWEQWIGKTDRFPVKGWSLNSALHSIPDCQSIVKKAIVRRLERAYGLSWFEETGALYQVQFTLMRDEAMLLIDTSGAGLHKRGYRAQAGEAPLKETLAAAIGDIMRVRRAEQIVDPCCGSGTLLIEAALAARRMAPGLRRGFAAERFAQVPLAVWEEERTQARALELADRPLRLIGGDIDPAMLQLTRQNAAKAGVSDCLQVRRQELARFVPEGDSGVVLCNPPYGERMADKDEAARIIREMGRVFVKKSGWSYAIISPEEQFETLFGRRADKRRKLYNGMLRCQLYMYF